jgi:hypothetical protein
MVEMLETARQMTAQLDTRAARLEVLIRDADDRLAALRTAAPPTTVAPAAPPHVAPLGPQAAEEPAAADAPPAAAEFTPADLTADSSRSVSSEPPETPPDPRHAEVYSMADLGHSPREIARSLDRPNGEVELILALRRR